MRVCTDDLKDACDAIDDESDFMEESTRKFISNLYKALETHTENFVDRHKANVNVMSILNHWHYMAKSIVPIFC